MRKNIFNQLIFSGIFLTSSQVSFASDVNNNFEASAKIENFCSIQANDVNFGVVALPLTAQSSKSDMVVKCSNAAAYTIDLAYGGVYGQGSNSGGKTYSAVATGGTRSNNVVIQNIFSIFIDGVRSPHSISCFLNGNVSFSTQEIAEMYGATNVSVKLQIEDNYGACAGVNINEITLSSLGGIPAYSYGVMNGAIKGDSLAYKITIPSDSTKVWNKGNNTYTSIGTGVEQTIDINAQIVPDKSSSKYVAQDVYLDNVTAEITY